MSYNEDWKEVKLGDVCEINKNNYSAKDCWDFINYLDTGNITENNIDEIQTFNTCEDKIPSRAKRKIIPNDIIYSTVRPNQKHFGIIHTPLKNMIVSTGFAVLSEKPTLAMNRFVYYFLSQNSVIDILHTIAEHSTSTYPALKPSDLENVFLKLPPLPEQKAIADTLSCLDDKIELNNKMNKNLEAQAQAIFKSWFVDFEPFQDGEFVDSELGKIPKGWRVGTLGEVAEILMGQSPKGKSYNEEKIGTVFYQGRTDFGIRYPKVRLYTTEPKRIASENDILLSVRAPVGDINIAGETCCIGRGLASLKSNIQCNSFVFYYLLELRDQFNVYNGEGTVFGSINKDTLNNIKTIIPKQEIIMDFQKITGSMDSVIKINSKQTQTLTNLRDTLLPKLMSGKVPVPIKEVE